MIFKKIISLILVFIISFSVLIVTCSYSDASNDIISNKDVQKTVKYAKGLVGTYYKSRSLSSFCK